MPLWIVTEIVIWRGGSLNRFIERGLLVDFSWRCLEQLYLLHSTDFISWAILYDVILSSPDFVIMVGIRQWQIASIVRLTTGFKTPFRRITSRALLLRHVHKRSFTSSNRRCCYLLIRPIIYRQFAHCIVGSSCKT